ncbi:hypothetical protein KCTC52924_02971 [Arenibacter antarcticus]|uniref:Oligosaccharide flippase family protein n=1 Tax=Arenibacter antarcticus TaxID=2040469 RepID=A0ABW5VJX0_9FLAO|nr:oligosaccharide flippase family protein [Arenibacter sp. H213]
MLKSAFWSFFDRVLFQLINLIIAIIIARYLGPKQLGIIAIITGYVYFLNIFVDGGMTISIIRSKHISATEISSIFYFNFLVSIFFIILTFAISNTVEKYFQVKELAYYLNISSLILLFNSFAFVRYAKLEQKMKFKLLSIINLITIIISGTICLVMLNTGFGIFAVVLFGINTSIIKNSCYLILTPNFKLKKFNLQALKLHLRFGKNLLLSSSIEAIYSNGFPILITKLFTGYDAGIFFQSKKLIDGPTNLISGASRRLLLPSAAKFDNDLEKSNLLLMNILKSVNFVLVLMLALLFINAEYIILKLMGPEWHDSIIILRILIFGMLFYPSFFLCVDIFKVQGASHLYSRIIIFSRIFSIILVLLSSFLGFYYLVAFFSIAQLLIYLIVVYKLKIEYSFSMLNIFKTIFPFIFIMVPTLYLLDLIEIEVKYPLIILGLKSLLFIVVYLCSSIRFMNYNPLRTIYLKVKK